MYKNFLIEVYEGEKLNMHLWETEKETKAVVQIVHGMGEHGKRYENFAQYLNKQGITVYADDHRGHGKTAKDIENLGNIGRDGFNKMVEDEREITDYIIEKHKVPVFIFAHSMGSFVIQEYITKYSEKINGVILSGSAGKFGADLTAGKILAGMIYKLTGGEKPSRILEKLCFGDYNKRIKNKKTDNDWLSNNDEEVKKYNDDPYCGTVFPAIFYYHFFKALASLHRKSKLEKISKKLSLLLIAGKEDPVGKYGKSVENLYRIYKKLSIEDLSKKVYKDGRHELLSDMKREEVFEFLKMWIEKRI